MLELKDFQLSGNVVHTTWFKTIKKDSGKPHLLAINLLADIVYWYKPTELRDEVTGEHIGWRNKYKSDLLQKSYKSLAEQFGMSTGQIKDAILKLEELGVIERVFRDIPTGESIAYNVMFLKLNIVNLKKLSEVSENTPSKNKQTPVENSIEVGAKKDTPLSEKEQTPVENSAEVGVEKDVPPSKIRQTNTEITTKTTTEITTKTTTKKKTSACVQEFIVNLFKTYAGADTELLETLIAFNDMRNGLKNGRMTERAAELMLKDLNRLGTNRFMKIAILNRSIQNNWKGLFELPQGYIAPEQEVIHLEDGSSIEVETKPKNALDRLRERYGE